MESKLNLDIVLEDKEMMPERQHEDDAAFDLKSSVDITIPPMGRYAVPTGVSVGLRRGFVGYINPRSGLAAKHGITVLNAPGTIDAGYTGELKVILINLSNEEFHVKKGDRIAQFVTHRIEEVSLNVVDSLEETERGINGFGSTGV